LLLTGFTGFTGLVCEITWQKYLATLLGSHGEATAAVLAIFLGGLALGYVRFGRLTQALVTRSEGTGRAPRLLLACGIVEAPGHYRGGTEPQLGTNRPRGEALHAEYRAAPEARSVGVARDATDLFVRYYHHAFPFRRETLGAISTRWPLAQAVECANVRRQAEGSLGDLRVGVASFDP
jgi:hypothetical protein